MKNNRLNYLRERRSVRVFKPDPVPDEYITSIIEAARWAPSGANAQPWEFIIVKDPVTRDTMAEQYLKIRMGQYYIEQTRIVELRHHQLSIPPTNKPNFKDAPVLIIVCGDRRTIQGSTLAARYISFEGGLDGTYLKGIANATYGLHLAATSLGLGSQWLSVCSEWEQMLKTLLGVPIILQIHTVVPIGYPLVKPKPPYRRKLKDIIHCEKYDMSKFRSDDQIIQYIRELRNRTKAAYDQEKQI